jgi:hypothetical protein
MVLAVVEVEAHPPMMVVTAETVCRVVLRAIRAAAAAEQVEIVMVAKALAMVVLVVRA